MRTLVLLRTQGWGDQDDADLLRDDPALRRREVPQAFVDRMAVRARLSTIDKLKLFDARYPADIARGVSYYRAGMWANAAAAFRKHIVAHADGPYGLHVQNYLKASLDRARAAGF